MTLTLAIISDSLSYNTCGSRYSCSHLFCIAYHNTVTNYFHSSNLIMNPRYRHFFFSSIPSIKTCRITLLGIPFPFHQIQKATCQFSESVKPGCHTIVILCGKLIHMQKGHTIGNMHKSFHLVRLWMEKI